MGRTICNSRPDKRLFVARVQRDKDQALERPKFGTSAGSRAQAGAAAPGSGGWAGPEPTEPSRDRAAAPARRAAEWLRGLGLGREHPRGWARSLWKLSLSASSLENHEAAVHREE